MKRNLKIFLAFFLAIAAVATNAAAINYGVESAEGVHIILALINLAFEGFLFWKFMRKV